jgi:hypothetical protein
MRGRRFRSIGEPLLLFFILAAWGGGDDGPQLALRLLLSGVVLIDLAVASPRIASLVLVSLCGLSFVTSKWRDGRLQAAVRHVLELVVPVTIGVVAFTVLAGSLFLPFANSNPFGELRQAFFENPFNSMNVVLFGLLSFMVARSQPRRAVALAVRAALFLGCVGAWLGVLEFLTVGLIGLGSQGLDSTSDWATVAGALALLVLGAVVLRYVFQLQAPRWAIVLSMFAGAVVVLGGFLLQFLPIR